MHRLMVHLVAPLDAAEDQRRARHFDGQVCAHALHLCAPYRLGLPHHRHFLLREREDLVSRDARHHEESRGINNGEKVHGGRDDDARESIQAHDRH